MHQQQPQALGTSAEDRAFVEAVSLIAALEGCIPQGNPEVVAFLGMARAELVDFGQRSLGGYLLVEVADLDAGLEDLHHRLNGLIAGSQNLQHSLRIEAALRWLGRAIETRARMR